MCYFLWSVGNKGFRRIGAIYLGGVENPLHYFVGGQ